MNSATMSNASAPIRSFGEPHLRTDGDLQLLAFAPDGSFWSIEEPGVLRRWSGKGQPLETQDISDLESLWAFSHDTRILVSGGDDLTLWDTSSGHVLTALAQDSWVTAIALNPNPEFLAAGHDDGSIRYWDFAGHVAVHVFRHHVKAISALAIHGDGKTLAAASEDKTISLWDLKTGQMIGVLRGHTDRVAALVWHPTEHFLVSAGWDTTARVWDATTLKPVILLNAHAAQVTALAFNAAGTLLATADSGLDVRVWDFNNKRVLHTLGGATSDIRSLSFGPDGSTLAASGDRAIHLWNAVSGQPLAGTGKRSQAKPSVAVHPDGSRLATNGGGRSGAVWNAANGATMVALDDDEELRQVAYSPDGRWLAAGAGTHLRVWNAATGKVHLDCDESGQRFSVVAFSSDSSKIATASDDGLDVVVWNVADGEPLLMIPDAIDGCAIQSLAFHPNGNLLAVGGIDVLETGGSSGAVSIWNIIEKAEVATVFEGVTALAFHPDGESIAAATLDHAICVYDSVDLNLREEFLGHEDNATSLAYSPDGQHLASASDDRTLRLWDADGYEVARVEVDSTVTAVAFDRRGANLFTAHANTTCRQYAVEELMNG